MAASTSKLGIPYPTSGDKVSDYPGVAAQAAALIEKAIVTTTLRVTNDADRSMSSTAVELANITTTLTHTSRVLIFAQAQFRPGGNAAGSLRVLVDGSTVQSQAWHSQGSSSHQWPAIMCGVTLPAGSHTISLTGEIGQGSSATSAGYASISAEIPA